MIDGDQVPVIPLVEVVGNRGTVAPLHIVVGKGRNVGADPGLTVTVMDTRMLSQPFTTWLTQ